MVIVYLNVQGVVDPVMVIVYFDVQGVVDPRDGHFLLYGVKGDLWEHYIPNNQKGFSFFF